MSDNKSNYEFVTAAEWKARHREGKDAPHGWCRCCDVTPLAIIQYNDKNHYKCPECDPNWLEEVMAGGEDEDEDEYDEDATTNCLHCFRIHLCSEEWEEDTNFCSEKCHDEYKEAQRAKNNKPDSK